ncbi:uncharacterized protein [Asterias amurensis]|uniref:uncharacterized protein n=1 Tax=Asterias amurensis TaxID=7602 RepID=UPI003AB54BDD
MAATESDRLKPSVENEGVTEDTNSKISTDPDVRTRLEISHNAPHTSPLSQGEKRKSTSPDNGGGQKKARPFSMSFGVKSKSGGEATSVKQDVGGDSAEGRNEGRTKTAVIQPIRSITMKLMQKSKEPELKMPASRAVAKAFTDDSDDEEEMPPEAKMRMKNVGRETPTSAGPNSYNKSKYGFNDHARVWKKSVESPAGEKKVDQE